jgi:hypothetical protein
MVVALLGGVTLSEYLFKVDLEIDRILLPKSVTLVGTLPGRPSPQTSASFVLTGAAFLLLGANGFAGLLSQLLSMATATIAGVAALAREDCLNAKSRRSAWCRKG